MDNSPLTTESPLTSTDYGQIERVLHKLLAIKKLPPPIQANYVDKIKHHYIELSKPRYVELLDDLEKINTEPSKYSPAYFLINPLHTNASIQALETKVKLSTDIAKCFEQLCDFLLRDTHIYHESDYGNPDCCRFTQTVIDKLKHMKTLHVSTTEKIRLMSAVYGEEEEYNVNYVFTNDDDDD